MTQEKVVTLNEPSRSTSFPWVFIRLNLVRSKFGLYKANNELHAVGGLATLIRQKLGQKLE